jgi:hypothetical protein
MSLGKKLIILTSLLIIATTNICPTADARSVYVISNTGTYEDDTPVIQAYEISGASVALRTEYEAHHPFAIALAIDADNEFLFVTHEEFATMPPDPPIPGNRIEIVNAKTMEYVGRVTATNASDLAGIAYDHGKQKLYVVDRETPNLFVYSWHPEVPQLVLVDEVELPGLIYATVGGAWGLALDESNQRLWVTSNEQKIRFYNTADWSHNAGTDYIQVSQKAVGIGVDTSKQYIYTGASQLNLAATLIVKYDLSAEPNSAESTADIETPVIGIAVDQQTGLVYFTTYGSSGDLEYSDPPKDRLFVFDSNLTQLWVSGDIGNPAGVAVAGDVCFRWPYLGLEKVQDVNACLVAGDPINYTITYDACGFCDSNVALTDYLADEVDFNTASAGYNYDVFERTVTWRNIGELEPNESNSVTLTVIVNQRADLNRAITNRCRIEGDTYGSRMARVDANVCCSPIDIIYVDEDAAGYDTGISWFHAYNEVESALNRARTCDANEIWVAAGTYIPTRVVASYPTFELVDGVPLYGGFAGYETLREQRNWLVNETVLSGDTDYDPEGEAHFVVAASDINEGTIDGFVIEKSQAGGAVISCSHAGVTIEHNRIIHGGDGVKLHGCWGSVCYNEIRDNTRDGVVYYEADGVLLANNWIHHNYDDGVDITYNVSWWGPLLRNNTIVDNAYYGLYAWWADVNNCIIWGNAQGSMGPDGDYYVTYSCIEGGYGGEGNIDDDPCFVGDANDPNNYHLRSDSPCIDTGNNEVVTDPNETDIDGEKRIIDGDSNGTATVDMGADEYYWSLADFNLDGFVNFIDYAIFAEAWQCSLGEAGYDPNCNLAEDNNSIDCNDLRVFCEDWLWYASWTLEVPGCRDGGMAGGKSMAAESAAETLESEAYQPDVEELLKWLEELWLRYEELGKTIPEDEWLKFIEAVKSAVE